MRAQPEDRAEQDAHPGRPVRGAALRREDREEEGAQPQRPGEQRADRDVVRAGTLAQRADHESAADRRHEHAGQQVEPEDGGAESPGEGDVAERVAREDLRAQDDEVADQPAGEADEGPGEQSVAHELVREHQRAQIRTST